MESAPLSSAARHAARSSSTEQCCVSSWTPTLNLATPALPPASALEEQRAVQRHVLQLQPVQIADVPAVRPEDPHVTDRAERLGHAEGAAQADVQRHPIEDRHRIQVLVVVVADQ